MDRVRRGARILLERPRVFWEGVPPGVRRVILFVAVAGLLPWLTFTSHDVANYVVGAEQVLAFDSDCYDYFPR